MFANAWDEIKTGFNEAVKSGKPVWGDWSSSSEKPQGVVNTVGRTIGRMAGDVMTDGTRRFYWMGNHPLGLSQIIGQNAAIAPGIPQGFNRVGGAILSLGVVPVLSGNFDVTNLGEFGRPKGYTALFPNPMDKTQTTNPVGEFVGRYFMGRKGNLLPYDQLHEELPWVTPENYASAVQGQNFMNRSLWGIEDNPLLTTGIGAAVGGVLGAYQGREGTRIVMKPRQTEPGSPYYFIPEEGETIHPTDAPRQMLRRGAKGAAIGAVLGAIAPSAIKLGLIHNSTTLNGQPSLSMLGYEVPWYVIPATGLAAYGVHQGAGRIGSEVYEAYKRKRTIPDPNL